MRILYWYFPKNYPQNTFLIQNVVYCDTENMMMCCRDSAKLLGFGFHSLGLDASLTSFGYANFLIQRKAYLNIQGPSDPQLL